MQFSIENFSSFHWRELGGCNIISVYDVEIEFAIRHISLSVLTLDRLENNTWSSRYLIALCCKIIITVNGIL